MCPNNLEALSWLSKHSNEATVLDMELIGAEEQTQELVQHSLTLAAGLTTLQVQDS